MSVAQLKDTVVVIKIGSNVLTTEQGKLDRSFIAEAVSQVVELVKRGLRPVIVTSAAIAAGFEAMGFEERPTDIPSLQAVASVGQVELVKAYSEELEKHGINAGQILITRTDMSNRTAYLHARDTFTRLIELNAIPIVNENDTIAVDEIKFGDNDTLAAMIGLMLNAKRVIMLTDIDGLYDKNPREHEDAKHISLVHRVDDELLSFASGAGSKLGTGGMKTKLSAAKMLLKAGIEMALVDGRSKKPILGAVDGSQKGTYFIPQSVLGGLNHKKRWIAMAGIPAGNIIIDRGAVKALQNGGVSLLSPGIISCSGGFKAGEMVSILDEDGALVARGLCSVDEEEVFNCKKHLVVHCDDLVLL